MISILLSISFHMQHQCMIIESIDTILLALKDRNEEVRLEVLRLHHPRPLLLLNKPLPLLHQLKLLQQQTHRLPLPRQPIDQLQSEIKQYDQLEERWILFGSLKIWIKQN